MIKEPNFIHLPELNYPKVVQKTIKAMDSAVSLWAEEDTEYAVRQQAVTDAERQDALALKKAALAGEPDPGTEATAQEQRASCWTFKALPAIRRQAPKSILAELESKLIVPTLSPCGARRESWILETRTQAASFGTPWACQPD